MLRLPKKVRLVGREQIDRDLQLTRVRTTLQEVKIFAVAVELVIPQPLREPAHDQGFLLIGEIDPGNAVNPGPDRLEFRIGNR